MTKAMGKEAQLAFRRRDPIENRNIVIEGTISGHVSAASRKDSEYIGPVQLSLRPVLPFREPVHTIALSFIRRRPPMRATLVESDFLTHLQGSDFEDRALG